MRRFLDALFIVLAIAALKRTFVDAENYAEDFHVYWKAANTWLHGGNPYAFTAQDAGFVFKYPPWILPLFLPFGAMEWEWARRAWFVVEVACVQYILRWVIRHGVSRSLAATVACLFWWLTHGHFAAGQFTLVLTCVALWSWPAGIREGDPQTLTQGNGFREGALAFIFSAKVFSLFSLLGIRRRYFRLGPWVWCIGMVTLAHGLLIAVARHAGNSMSIVDYYRSFMLAATSGGAELGAEIVRGQGNHGFSALILRTLQVDSTSFACDALTSLIVVAVLGILWERYARGLTSAEHWAGWLGIGLVAHPLAWHHSFVLAYPLCALAIAGSHRVKDRKLIAMAWFGTCCIGIIVPQVVGKTIVKPLELGGMKSWGVVLAAVALAAAARRRRGDLPHQETA
jgi:hypothetical protein